jgi:hypothetical protein
MQMLDQCVPSIKVARERIVFCLHQDFEPAVLIEK